MLITTIKFFINYLAIIIIVSKTTCLTMINFVIIYKKFVLNYFLLFAIDSIFISYFKISI